MEIKIDRKDITKLLTNTLINTRLNDRKYYATEVTLDYTKAHPKRIDVMQFIPINQYSNSGLEAGSFVCYEIKSCYEDVYSGNGLNFYGEKNYIVTTMEVYKKLILDIRQSDKFRKHLEKTNPESSLNYGIMVLVPKFRQLEDEFNEPTEISLDGDYEIKVAIPCHSGHRYRSIIELLFCMLRSGK